MRDDEYDDFIVEWENLSNSIERTLTTFDKLSEEEKRVCIGKWNYEAASLTYWLGGGSPWHETPLETAEWYGLYVPSIPSLHSME